jgi:cell division control protein 45
LLVLERADNDLLWLAILSITHQYIASKIDRDQYEVYHGLFTDEVARLNAEPLGTKMPNPDDRSIARSLSARSSTVASRYSVCATDMPDDVPDS